MANGATGLPSVLVQKVVEEDIRFVQEFVITHHHKTEEKIVKEILYKIGPAIFKIVQVKTSLTLKSFLELEIITIRFSTVMTEKNIQIFAISESTVIKNL